jgi:hypothetical protein
MITSSIASRTLLSITVIALVTTSVVSAQWSLLAPGTREAPAGQHRYAMLVLANPVPGLEQEFNDWYTNTHMGDLVQLDGWAGAQRFRIVTNVDPRPTDAGYNLGYLIIWDLEDVEANAALTRMDTAIAGGKSRRGAAFNYTPGAGGRGTYETLGARVTRPDGKRATMPAAADNKTPRPNRYILMEFSDALPGKDAEYEKARIESIGSVLKLPGWMAAQRYQAVDTPVRAGRTKPKYLTIWEAEGLSAQEINATLQQAIKSGAVKKNPMADEKSADIVYWEPITPYITKEDFVR